MWVPQMVQGLQRKAKCYQTVFVDSLTNWWSLKVLLVHCPKTPVRFPQHPQGIEDAANALVSAVSLCTIKKKK